MDPNATLEEIRRIVKAWDNGQPADLDRLAEVVGGLDDWLTCGGFLPAPWSR